MNQEFVIDFKEFFWRLLEQWKAIVVFVLVIVLLFSGFMYAKRASAIDTEDASQTDSKSIEDILESLNAKDQEMVLGTLREKTNRDNLQDYVSTSPFMSLDPYRVKTLKISILINSDEEINKQLASAYSNELMSSDMAKAINDSWGNDFEADQVKELINANSSISLDTEAKLEGNIVNMTVFIPEEKDPDQAVSAVKELLPSITSSLTKSIGDHTAKVIDTDVQIISDEDFSLRQYDVFTRLYNMTYHITYLTGLMTAEQKEAYQKLLNYEDGLDPNNSENTNVVPTSIPFFTTKGVAIGFILGCLIYGFVYLLFFALSGRVLSAETIRSAYGLRILGEWYRTKKTGLLAFLFTSSAISKLRHRGHLSMEAEINRAAESIVNGLKDNTDKKLLIVSGGGTGNYIETFVNNLKQTLTDREVTAEIVDIDASEGMYLGESALAGCDSAVLMLDSMKSDIKDLRDLSEKCNYCGTPLLGAIYID